MRTIVGAGVVAIALLAGGPAGAATEQPPAGSQTQREQTDQGHGTHSQEPAAAVPEARADEAGPAAADDLDRLLAEMQAASGDAKTAAMAALLTRLVEVHRAQATAGASGGRKMSGSCPMMSSHEHGPPPRR